jgi:hypothetical protein
VCTASVAVAVDDPSLVTVSGTESVMVGACANKAPEPARTNRTNFFIQHASTSLNSNNVGYNEPL